MELTGKIIKALELQTGTSAKGLWKKQSYILETEGEYPKKICFMVWGDMVDTFKPAIGQTVKLEIDVESREYNDKWYTDVRAWKFRLLDSPEPIDSRQGRADETPEDDDSEDDLPF